MIDLLVLVRHGDAELFGSEGTDESRHLTAAGVKALATDYPQTFARLRDRDDVSFWVSPATRARQTAEIAAATLGIDPKDFVLHESLYAQEDDIFLAELEAEGDGCVVAVGHVPFMQRLLFELTGCDLPFGKGCVAAVSFAGGDLRRASLAWFVQGPSK